MAGARIELHMSKMFHVWRSMPHMIGAAARSKRGWYLLLLVSEKKHVGSDVLVTLGSIGKNKSCLGVWTCMSLIRASTYNQSGNKKQNKNKNKNILLGLHHKSHNLKIQDRKAFLRQAWSPHSHDRKFCFGAMYAPPSNVVFEPTTLYSAVIG